MVVVMGIVMVMVLVMVVVMVMVVAMAIMMVMWKGWGSAHTPRAVDLNCYNSNLAIIRGQCTRLYV
jgi:hypothetical protein